MNKNLKITLCLGGVFLPLLVTFFVPFCGFTVNNETIVELGFQALFQHGWHPEVLVFALVYALLFASVFLVIFSDKHKSFAPLALIFSLSAGATLIFSTSLLNNIYGVKGVSTSFNFGLILVIIESILLIIGSFISIDKETALSNISVSSMCEISIFVALAVVLDIFCKIDVNAGAGSIGFAMLPLMIICLRHGPVKGFIACGVVFGIITCFTDGWGLHTFPFDYLLGFGATAIMGLFKNFILPKNEDEYTIKADSEAKQFAIGVGFILLSVTLVFVGRTLASTISGMLYYELNFIDSLIYQMAYIPATVFIDGGILLVLYKPLLVINKHFKTR